MDGNQGVATYQIADRVQNVASSFDGKGNLIGMETGA
jgi:hypothetical protein